MRQTPLQYPLQLIKIETYWNVNDHADPSGVRKTLIKIETYWNVNLHQGGTSCRALHIKIETYWNVNVATLMYCSVPMTLKQKHIGM